MFPEEWKESDNEADFDLIEISLDQMEAAINAGEREQAEQARLSAYAFFEFGPERFLNSLDPQLVAEVEGLVWYGARDKEGLAELIANDGSGRDIRDTRLTLDEALDEARQATGEGASGITVVTNAALIVFREGLEAILIIAAITASMIGANRGFAGRSYVGPCSPSPPARCSSSSRSWSWTSSPGTGRSSRRSSDWSRSASCYSCSTGSSTASTGPSGSRAIESAEKRWRARGRRVAAGTTVAGLYLLGFTSVFREGFETVLFLQALQLEAGVGIVLAGVSLGLLFTAAVGAVTFALERRLPYKRMLIVTGVLISLVLVVLVGNTVRTLQGVGWISITPIDIDLPLWMGTWLGVFPTWETIGGQIAAFAFVIGSYFLAEWVRKRSVRRPRAQPAAVVLNGGNGNRRSRVGEIDLSRPPRRLEPDPKRQRTGSGDRRSS